MGNSISLAANKRDVIGKKVKDLRAKGIIPGVVYGHGNPTDHIELNAKEFTKVFKEAGSNTIVDLTVDGKAVKTIIYEVTFDPTSEAPRHVDFYRVKMNEKLTTTVPLNFVGESAAVRTLSAIIVHNKDELEITCLPADLPHEIQVDISKLAEINDMIHVSDLTIPANVEVSEDPETVIAQAILPKEEVIETPAAPAEGEMPAEGAAPVEGGEAAPAEGGEEKKE
ncbi:MAG: 50S ribosomal protein L25 [Candidatus Abawacabacteria bacterium]|nr:50S ribosomal protein L25 [Candidatus Abawacabacteria bacterium]